MKRLPKVIRNSLSLVAVVALVSACRMATSSDDQDSTLCPQTFEFGNYGCARVTVLVEGPPKPWPEFYRFDIRAAAARKDAGFDSSGPAASPNIGSVRLQLTRWSPGPAGTGDTVTVWIVARMLDDVRPIVVGVPLPTFAADSISHVLTFASVGSSPKADTVRLILR